MKRKKDLLEKIGDKIIFNEDKVKISQEGNQWVFEINNELTTDIAEATALMMRICSKDSFLREIEIKGINTDEISPKKSYIGLQVVILSGKHYQIIEILGVNHIWNTQRDLECLL